MIFLICSCIVFIVVTIFIPKRLSKSEIYAVAMFSIVLGVVTDITLVLKYHYYEYFSSGVQFGGFLPILILFPCSGIVFMNFYPFKKTLQKQILYIFWWTIFCLIFEFLSIKSGYFHHIKWTLWYSAFTYPFLFVLHLVHIKFFKKLL
jgi:hypothetical protein